MSALTRKMGLKVGGGIALGLGVLLGSIAGAEAVIKIDKAEVREGMAFVRGSGAVPGAPITWEGAQVAVASSPSGRFTFRGVLPADCRGELSDTTTTILIDVLRCTPAPAGPPAPVEVTGKKGCYDRFGFPAPATAMDGTETSRRASPFPPRASSTRAMARCRTG